MKVPLHIVKARREKLAQLLREHRYLPVNELCTFLGVSEATARRDLAALAQENKVTRTYGGALADFNNRFPSFNERCAADLESKSRLAKTALSLFEPNGTYFLDSGTTVFAIAKAFKEKPVTPIRVVTCNLPVGELLSEIQGIEVFQLAGQLLKRQSVLMGETARRSLDFWHFDVAFLSAEAMDATGIWNSEAAIIDQQKAVMKRSARTVFLLGGSKVGKQAPHLLAKWGEVDVLVSDAGAEDLERAGIKPGIFVEAGAEEIGGKLELRGGPGELPVHYL